MTKSAQKLVVDLVRSQRYLKAQNRVKRYTAPVAVDDLLGEFNVGIMEGAQDVKMNRGNPTEYLIWRGMTKVRLKIRSESGKQIIEECLECGKTRVYRQCKCTQCGGRNFMFHPRFVGYKDSNDGRILPSGNATCKTVLGGRKRSVEAHSLL